MAEPAGFEEDDSLSLDVAEDDLAADISPDSTVTWSTDWTTSTIIDQLKRERFDLEPDFQRRDVWSASKRSRFIESLLVGIPVPQIILAERQNNRGKFIVLDGKQRLRSLQRFAGLDGPPMRLTGLEVLTHLNGLTYDDLRNDPDLDNYVAALENAAVRAVVLRGWRNESLLYLTFLRLNSNVVGLSPQELRRALHPGPFMDYVMQRSSDSEQILWFLNKRTPDFRMRDAELLLRHLALSMRLDRYKGDLRAFLDATCETGNKNWSDLHHRVDYHAAGLDGAIDLTWNLFGKDSFKRYGSAGYESRKNRAVLDVMAFYFQHPEIRNEVEDAQSQVVEAFEYACRDDNSRFSDFLTATTKSTTAVFGRLSIWGQILSEIAPSTRGYVPSI